MLKVRQFSAFLLKQRKTTDYSYLSSTFLSPSWRTPSYRQIYKQQQRITSPNNIINKIESPATSQAKSSTPFKPSINSNNSANPVKKKRITIYHYIRPLVQGTVGSIIIFAIAGTLDFNRKLKQAQERREKAKEEKKSNEESVSNSSTSGSSTATDSSTDEPSTNNSSNTTTTKQSSGSEQPSSSSKVPTSDNNSVDDASTSTKTTTTTTKTSDSLFDGVNTGELVLIGINTAVLLCWRFKGVQGFMKTWFQHSVTPRTKPLTLLTATFSHQKLLVHYVPNMVALSLFFNPVVNATSQYEAIAIYLSAGVMGFSASHVVRLAWYHHFGQKLVPSLGASGSIMGLIGVVICTYDVQQQRDLMHVNTYVYWRGA
ncbi:hypothetical protein INT45_011968 [Circinella minor]|uniref:Peptidase S54 rhomboid domain-containing protein n=1 Tax=Circinella minor TaxID=1195481 RepID=A0A8H7VP77_9FUNG|nr:hypothetical protein INT45_011968 [Circinella minor]